MNNYRATLEEIRVESSAGKPLGASDENLLSSVSNETADPEYTTRNKLYSSLLNEYIKEYTSKNLYKKWYKFVFFIITMFALLALVTVPLLVILIVASSLNESNIGVDANSIALIAGSVAGIISAIIILPRIIAEHLFPTNEENHLIEMVKNMQTNDSGIRESLNRK